MSEPSYILHYWESGKDPESLGRRVSKQTRFETMDALVAFVAESTIVRPPAGLPEAVAWEVEEIVRARGEDHRFGVQRVERVTQLENDDLGALVCRFGEACSLRINATVREAETRLRETELRAASDEVHAAKATLESRERLLERNRDLLNEAGLVRYAADVEQARERLAQAERDLYALAHPKPAEPEPEAADQAPLPLG